VLVRNGVRGHHGAPIAVAHVCPGASCAAGRGAATPLDLRLLDTASVCDTRISPEQVKRLITCALSGTAGIAPASKLVEAAGKQNASD